MLAMKNIYDMFIYDMFIAEMYYNKQYFSCLARTVMVRDVLDPNFTLADTLLYLTY